MEIIRSQLPLLIELNDDDVVLMHMAFYEYKNYLKKNKKMNLQKKRRRMQKVCRAIALVDLML